MMRQAAPVQQRRSAALSAFKCSLAGQHAAHSPCLWPFFSPEHTAQEPIPCFSSPRTYRCRWDDWCLSYRYVGAFQRGKCFTNLVCIPENPSIYPVQAGKSACSLMQKSAPHVVASPAAGLASRPLHVSTPRYLGALHRVLHSHFRHCSEVGSDFCIGGCRLRRREP